jgi:hypothetical protein
MSAHFDVSKISFFGLDDWTVAVCAWRGCCIEVFARAEHSVADCLKALEKTGVTLCKDARSPAAITRLRALNSCIARHDFGHHGAKAQTRIADWGRVYETRAFLAHGTVKATRNGIVIQHRTFDAKGEKRLPPRQITRLSMLEMLAELEEAQSRLHQQLGHIKAIAAKMKPVTKSKEPGPGSSPG